MELSEIKELIQLMKDTDFTELEIEKENFKIALRKQTEKIIQPEVTRIYEPAQGTNNNILSTPVKETAKEEMVDCTVIKSPIVGTFYSSPSPDADMFVKVGQNVSKGDVLCIIEAMKLMNEIESDVSGEIVEILVDNEQMVEYGQPLFKIKTK